MDKKVLGIPLAVWVFLVGLALVIGLPSWVAYKNEVSAINQVNQNVLNLKVGPSVFPTVEATPSATPSVTLAPVKSFKPVTLPTKPLK